MRKEKVFATQSMLYDGPLHMMSKRILAVFCLVAQVFAASAQAATNALALEFTSIPPFGSTSDLFGRALNVNPATFRVAVYIFVGGWYNKPLNTAPLTTIQANGNWVCDITTGGNDP